MAETFRLRIYNRLLRWYCTKHIWFLYFQLNWRKIGSNNWCEYPQISWLKWWEIWVSNTLLMDWSLPPKNEIQVGWVDGVWLVPPEVQQFAPEKLPKPNRKGSSSNHHFFRGKLLNFMGSMCFFFGEQLIFFFLGGEKFQQLHSRQGSQPCVCCFFIRLLEVAPSDFENLVTYYSNPSQLIHCWWFRNPGFTSWGW